MRPWVSIGMLCRRLRQSGAIAPLAIGTLCTMLAGPASAHGGGLNAEGCHTNRKTGEYHCHRSGAHAGVRPAPGPRSAGDNRSANGLAATPTPSSGPTCYTGPRGGTYTITASGRKNYGGC